MALLRLFRDPLRLLPRLHREYGEVAAINRGDPSLVCAFGPELNKQLLPHAGQFEHFGEVPLRVLEGTAFHRMQSNLVASVGDEHRRQRRLMMPAFGRGVIHGYRDEMVEIAERHLARWRPGQTVDMAEQMLEVTLAIMMKSLFGLGVGDQAVELGQMGVEFLQRVISPAAALLPLDLPLSPYRRLLRLSERFEARVLGLIEARRRSPGGQRDVLSMLIDAHDEDGSRMSDAELMGNMGLLFVAGHETTGYALTWTLLLLALHPTILGDLRDELQAELHGEAPTIEQLGRLPLLDAVVKEGLRMVPPAYIVFVRRATESFDLGPYRMPAGSMMVLSPLVTHHMPQIYPQPKRFRPERWSQGKRSPFEFLPFGAGPRLCLGAPFAEQEIRLVLALVVQRFGLRLAPGTAIDLVARGITLGPRGAVPMALASPERATTPPPSLSGSICDLVSV